MKTSVSKRKTKIRNPLLLLATSLLSGCAGPFLFSPTDDISCKEVLKMLNSNKEKMVLIDVRAPGEFKEEHIENAINVDYFSTSFEETLSHLPQEKMIVVYCKHGLRVKTPLRFLKIWDIRRNSV